MSAGTPRSARPRSRLGAVLVVGLGVGLLALSVAALLPPATPSPAAGAGGGTSTLDRRIRRRRPGWPGTEQDPRTWAELGTAYVEKARITANPAYYPKAEGALRTSLAQQPDGNGPALTGMGALANARHDFAAARDWGEQAKAVLPDTAEVYGVLTDAYTQLGDTEAATTAVQRMLDLKPGVSSFTRAAYEFELHGRVDDARHALDRALADAVDPADIAFCRYRLGELAFDNGDVDTAARHYEAGLRAVPRDAPLLQGRAKVAAARGQTDEGARGLPGPRVPAAEHPVPAGVRRAADRRRANGSSPHASTRSSSSSNNSRPPPARATTSRRHWSPPTAVTPARRSSMRRRSGHADNPCSSRTRWPGRCT